MHTHYSANLNDGKHVFVFGSNTAGRHGRGAALDAANYWGAEHYQNDGRCGQSYAIPTKNAMLRPLPLWEIRQGVQDFLAYAQEHPEITFLVTAVGCGLAGYSAALIAPMFLAVPLTNVVLPLEWKAAAIAFQGAASLAKSGVIFYDDMVNRLRDEKSAESSSGGEEARD